MMPPSSTAKQLCRRFTLSEIKSATGDFCDEHLIGRGGFGKVYKGLIDNGSTKSTVAMKRLASNSNQGEREFAAEMETLTKFRHRNLVSLIGYCNEQGEMILVYEYMTNGTLADNLYSGGSSLTWIQRLKICIGAARGIDYLHSGCSIIHRDVKSTNILLDENFIAKVSDFGLAKHLNADNLESFVSASVKGSFGYFDPCYFTTGRLTRASDTYAFGVVLLEVLSGKPAVDRRLTENELCLTMWAQEKFQNGKIDQIVAPKLRGEISDDCLKTFVGVAKRCLHYEPKKRLTMNRVVVQLELALEQQERKGSTNKSYFRTLNAFWSRVIPSGSSQMEDEQVEDNFPAISVPVQRQLAEMKAITKDFSSERLISEKSLNHSVFYGVLKSGEKVAVQKLKLYQILPDQEFLAKVSIISSLQHENVVKLLGYCVDGGEKVLAYEFAPRGSLHDILNGQERSFIMKPDLAILSWAQRINIAVEVAKGLDYVHQKALIHGNVKSSNVLLFDNKLAKITDFPLLTELSCETDSLEDRPMCYTYTGCGYHPPECTLSLQTQKWDVYSFGLVLLELLTGKYNRNKYIVDWAKPQRSVRNVHKIVDARLKGDYTPKAVAMMACVASACLDLRLEFRPDMSDVVRALQIASRVTQAYLLKTRYSQNTVESSWTTATPLAKMKDITDDLILKKLIANGSSRGCIFQGFLESGEHVAIRELYLNLPCQELFNQVSTVTRLKHENVVQLLGYCMDGGQLSLAFEFSPQGSLHDILHGQQDIELLRRDVSSEGCIGLQRYLKIISVDETGPRPIFSLAQRVRMSVEAAKGLEYIHQNAEIHGDFKSQRVLLFDEDVVKIAYVGRIYREEAATAANCPCSLDNKTYWYHAPECKIPGKRSWRSDVYSFGAVLMELLTRQKTVDHTQKLEQCIDHTLSLKGKNPHKPVLRMAGIAGMCLQYEADLRPSMSVVVEELVFVGFY